MKFIVDTGGTVWFIDKESVNCLIKQAKSRRKTLSESEHNQKYSDFNGNAVGVKQINRGHEEGRVDSEGRQTVCVEPETDEM